MKSISPAGGSKAATRVSRDVPAVTRAIKILRFLAKNREPVGVVPLARELKMIPSTCLHIIRVLLDNGMVTFNQNKRYALGPGVLAFATAYAQLNPFVHVVRTHLQELSHRHDCAFAAIEASGIEHYIVLAATDPPPGLSIRLAPGSRFPILISAAGLCFAAFSGMTPAQLKEGFAGLRWDNPPTFANWLKHVESTRASGYAVDGGDYMGGIAVVAVPVFNEGRMLGCVCAIGLREQIAGARLAALIESVRAAARIVSREMGHGASVGGESAALPPRRRPRRVVVSPKR
jgi:DNA-binding IclR family transcriptional regulator